MLEILVATLILVLGIIPVYNLLMAQSGQTRFNRNRSLAASIATRILARVRKLPPGYLKKLEASAPDAEKLVEEDPVLNPSKDELNPPTDEEIVKMSEGYERAVGRFKRTLTVEEDTDNPGMFRAFVVVKWDERLAPGAPTVEREFKLGQVVASSFLPTGKVRKTTP